MRNCEVFREAVRMGGQSIIVIANMPGGNLKPDNDTLYIANALEETGALLDLPMLDFILVGNSRYYSLVEKGHLRKTCLGVKQDS